MQELSKQHRLAMLAITGVLALSACGQTTTPTAVASTSTSASTGTDTPVVAPPAAQQVEGCASITVDLEGVAAVNGQTTAPVVVLDSSGAEAFSGTATNLVKLGQTFVPGTYTVKAGTLQGYAAANTPQSVTLDCDANKAKTVVLQFKTQATTQASVASLSFSGDVTDSAGAALPMQPEANLNKNVNLYASQTEEAMLVSMVVKDSSGAPVPGAAVNVSADSQSVVVVGGHVRLASSAARPLASQALSDRAVAYSDDHGVVRFTAYATNQADQNNPNVPVKFVVTATDAGGTGASAALLEFKTFFLNMSHLYYQGNTSFGASTSAPLASGQRLGGKVGSFENNWIDPAQRIHSFTTVAYTKQPQQGAYPVGGKSPFPGYVEYSVSGPGADRVFLSDTSGASSGGSDLKSAGGSVYLKTNDDVKVTDLGLNVQVKADYHYQVAFGSTTYDFLLKSYLFDKAFTGTMLDIQKTGPDIETWTGFDRTTPRHDAYAPDDVTLLPALDPGHLTPSLLDDFTVGKQYDYTITVKNTGKTVAKNVIVRDVLPAELGFVQGSVDVSKDGAALARSALLATYNAQRHAFNLSFTGTPGIGDLDPGSSYTVTFKVYPRQKPGYAWNDNNRDGQSDPYAANDVYATGAHGENAPLSGLYADPYMIKNRAKASADNAFETDAYKDIYVVRPLLEIDKSARQDVVYTNQKATFDITMRNINRAAEDPNPEVRAGYAAIQGLPGYAAEGFAVKPRLEDTYGYNLDFVNAYDAQGNLVTTLENLGNNSLALNLPDLAMGKSYSLSTVFQAENSVSGPGGRDGTGRAANWNCVRLYAWNLNQLPRNELTTDSLRTLAQTPIFPPLATQYEGIDPSYGSFVNINGTTGEFITGENGIDALGRNYLVSCDYVTVLDRPTFDLGLYDAARGTNGLTDYTPNPLRLTDAQYIPQGSYYEYDYSYTNESADSAHTVRSSMTLPAFASLNDLGVKYTTGGVSTNYSLAQVLAGVNVGGGRTLKATRSGNVVTMRVDTMLAHDALFAQFVMYANQAGSGKAVSALDWDENTTGSPLTEEEFTKVSLR